MYCWAGEMDGGAAPHVIPKRGPAVRKRKLSGYFSTNQPISTIAPRLRMTITGPRNADQNGFIFGVILSLAPTNIREWPAATLRRQHRIGLNEHFDHPASRCIFAPPFTILTKRFYNPMHLRSIIWSFEPPGPPRRGTSDRSILRAGVWTIIPTFVLPELS